MSNTQQARSAAEPVSAVPGAYEVDGVPVGSIRILDGAITTIVKRTVLGIEGVARLSGSSLIFIDEKESAAKGRSGFLTEQSFLISLL